MLPVYQELLNYVAEHISPEAMLAFRVSETEQERADELTEHNKEGRITPDEARELAEMIEFEDFVSLLKARALHQQHQPQRQ